MKLAKADSFPRRLVKAKIKTERTRVTTGDGGKDFTGRVLTLLH